MFHGVSSASIPSALVPSRSYLFHDNSERRSVRPGQMISAMIPQNRAIPTLYISKEIKFCFIFCVIIVLQVAYLHLAIHRTTAATSSHRHRFDPRHNVYPPNATFEQILGETSISDAAQSLPYNGTLFCFVLTSPKYHRTRVPAVASTWLTRCDHGQFYTSAPIPDYEHITQNRVHSVSVAYSTIFKRIPDEYDLLFSKTLLALRFSHRMYPEFEWYYKADDDTYVIVEHLRQFLSTLDPSLPHYIGYRLTKHIHRGYNSGGAGYVLSRAALEAFELADLYGDRERCPPCQYEDVGLGRCLANLTIFPEDARTAKGQHLFFPSRPDQIIRWKGADTISPETISFHHLSPQEMLDLELFTYFIDSPTR